MRFAHDWRGTPHVDRIAIRKKGVDCINFVCGVLIASGICPRFTMPYYDTAWGIGRSNNILERLALDCFKCEVLLDTEPWQFGDIGIFRVGRMSNHIGIVLDDELWHVSLGRMVEPEPITGRLMERIQSMVRLSEIGFNRHPETLKLEDFSHE